jgi:hypothetical protein
MFRVVVGALVENVTLVVGWVLRCQQFQKRLTVSDPSSLVVAWLK